MNLKWIMMLVLLSFIALLSACDSGGLVENQKPDYLTVFQTFKKTNEYQKCVDYEDKLREKESDNGAMPYDTKMDVDIVKDTFDNGVYKANLVCTFDVTYSLSATTFTHKYYRKSAGWFEIK